MLLKRFFKELQRLICRAENSNLTHFVGLQFLLDLRNDFFILMIHPFVALQVRFVFRLVLLLFRWFLRLFHLHRFTVNTRTYVVTIVVLAIRSWCRIVCVNRIYWIGLRINVLNNRNEPILMFHAFLDEICRSSNDHIGEQRNRLGASEISRKHVGLDWRALKHLDVTIDTSLDDVNLTITPTVDVLSVVTLKIIIFREQKSN